MNSSVKIQYDLTLTKISKNCIQTSEFWILNTVF